MAHKEADARIKINNQLEATRWRFFADVNLPSNIQLKPKVSIKTQYLDAPGNNFEKVSTGFFVNVIGRRPRLSSQN
ncbi:MAG: hypothetical protein NT163_05760 [Chlorobiales bacterium]|nr:hypothetical protein [Chlorobiales bacterium]